jgi:hypothetical protein
VIGASMGGLLAARALADYYDEVTIPERDDLTDATKPVKAHRRAAIRTVCSPAAARFSNSCVPASARRWSGRMRYPAMSSMTPRRRLVQRRRRRDRALEAKALGITMGEPWHLCRRRLDTRGLIVRSSNYAL